MDILLFDLKYFMSIFAKIQEIFVHFNANIQIKLIDLYMIICYDICTIF